MSWAAAARDVSRRCWCFCRVSRTARIDGIRHLHDISSGNEPRLPRQLLLQAWPAKTSHEVRKGNGLSVLTLGEWREVRFCGITTLGGVLFNAWD
jgi:hypothetical protein